MILTYQANDETVISVGDCDGTDVEFRSRLMGMVEVDYGSRWNSAVEDDLMRTIEAAEMLGIEDALKSGGVGRGIASSDEHGFTVEVSV